MKKETRQLRIARAQFERDIARACASGAAWVEALVNCVIDEHDDIEASALREAIRGEVNEAITDVLAIEQEEAVA